MSADDDVRDLLTLAAEPPDGPLRVDARDAVRRWRRRKRKQWFGLAAAVVLVAGVAIPGVFAIGHHRAPVSTVTTNPRPPAEGADAAELAAGHWATLPPAPIPARSGATVVWDGSELLVWGGAARKDEDVFRANGAAYNPATGRWRVLPAAPLSPRSGQAAVWTGHELLIWGGYNSAEQLTADGAAYDPSSNSWRMLPAAPMSARTDAFAVWTGSQAIFLGGHADVFNETAGNDGDGASFDPVSDTWRHLAAPYAPSGHGLQFSAVVQTDGELLAWSEWEHTIVLSPNATTAQYGADLFSYDEQDGQWRSLSTLPGVFTAISYGFWTGTAVVALGDNFCGGCAGPPQSGSESEFKPATGERVTLPRDPLGVGQPAAVWTGGALFEYGPTSEVVGGAAAYDPTRGAWTRIASAPPGCQNPDLSLIWTGRQVLSYCPTAASGGLSFTPGRASG
jgi:hypothetical protein